jgi:hypothetical protein
VKKPVDSMTMSRRRAPVGLGRVALGEDLDGLAVDGDRVLVVGDLALETAQDRVVLEQVRQGLVVGQVVDGHDLDVGAGPQRRGRSCGRCGRSR